jgi:hypothetical protein
VGSVRARRGPILGILQDAHREKRLAAAPMVSPGLGRELEHRLAEWNVDAPPAAFAAGPLTWTQVFGTISSELFGHFHNVIDDCDSYFEHVINQTTHDILRTPGTRRRLRASNPA